MDNPREERIQTLVAAAVKGTAGAKEQLFAALTPEVHRLARAILSGSGQRDADAEDLAQDALIRAWSAFDRYEARNGILGWLRTIVANLARDKYKSHHIAKTSVGEQETLEAIADAEDLPEIVAERHETAEEAAAALPGLDQLTARQRRALFLRHVEHWSLRRIAAELGVTVGAVKSLLARGLHRLRLAQAPLPQTRGASPRLSEPEVDAAVTAYGELGRITELEIAVLRLRAAGLTQREIDHRLGHALGAAARAEAWGLRHIADGQAAIERLTELEERVAVASVALGRPVPDKHVIPLRMDAGNRTNAEIGAEIGLTGPGANIRIQAAKRRLGQADDIIRRARLTFYEHDVLRLRALGESDDSAARKLNALPEAVTAIYAEVEERLDRARRWVDPVKAMAARIARAGIVLDPRGEKLLLLRAAGRTYKSICEELGIGRGMAIGLYDYAQQNLEDAEGRKRETKWTPGGRGRPPKSRSA